MSLHLGSVGSLAVRGFELAVLFVVYNGKFTCTRAFGRAPVPTFALRGRVGAPRVFGLPRVGGALSRAGPTFGGDVPLIGRCRLEGGFSCLSPIFANCFGRRRCQLFGSHCFKCRLCNSDCSLQKMNARGVTNNELMCHLGERLTVQVNNGTCRCHSGKQVFGSFALGTSLACHLGG